MPFFLQSWKKLCLGNTYATTIHAINTAIITLSAVLPSAKVLHLTLLDYYPLCTTAHYALSTHLSPLTSYQYYT